MDVKFDMTTRQKTNFGYLQATHDQYFLLVIPIDGVCQDMSPVEYYIILKYWLTILLFSVDEVCPICCKVCLDIL